LKRNSAYSQWENHPINQPVDFCFYFPDIPPFGGMRKRMQQKFGKTKLSVE
jgi:hypothetical protein